MEGYLDQGKEEKPKEGDETLVYSRGVNTNFGHMKTKGIATKRRTIARFKKDQKNLKTLSRHQGRDIITSHQQYPQR